MESRGPLAQSEGRIKRRGRLAGQSDTGQHQHARVSSPEEQQHGRSVEDNQRRPGDSGRRRGGGQRGKRDRHRSLKAARVFEQSHLLIRGAGS